MSKKTSVAPKERINITYKAPGDGQSKPVELPLKILMVGNFSCREDDTPLEERQIVSIDKDNFDEVLASQNLSVDLKVPDKISNPSGDPDEPQKEISVSMKFSSIRDFEPDAIAKKVPEVNRLLQLREALTALKGPLGNMPAFRRKMEALVSSAEDREKLLAEIEAASNKKTEE